MGKLVQYEGKYVAVLKVLFSTNYSPEPPEIRFSMTVIVRFPCHNPVPEFMQPGTLVAVYYDPEQIEYGGSLPIITAWAVGETFELEPGETKTVSMTAYARPCFIPEPFGTSFFRAYVNVFLTNPNGDIYPYLVYPCCHGNDYLLGQVDIRPHHAIKVEWVEILSECEEPEESKFLFHRGEVVKVQVKLQNYGKYEDTKTLTVGINYKLCCTDMFPIPTMTKNVEVTIPGVCECGGDCPDNTLLQEFNFVIPDDMPAGFYRVMAFVHDLGPLVTQQELFEMGLEPCYFTE